MLFFFCISVKIYSIIVAGGTQFGGLTWSPIEIILGDSKPKHLKNWPRQLTGASSSIVKHNDSILMTQGNNFKTFLRLNQLENGTWKKHKTLHKKRSFETAVATESATFVFGGINDSFTYEYLPKDSTTWVLGHCEIPDGFDRGYPIAIKSEQEIWLIGGYTTEQRILSFDVNDHTFTELPLKLNVGRYGHRCAYIPYTDKIIITGGFRQNTTEILNIETNSITMASPMNSIRSEHGIGILTINDENRVAVFGGYDNYSSLKSVELYKTTTEEWETTNIKLIEGKHGFGFLSVKLGSLKDDSTPFESFANRNMYEQFSKLKDKLIKSGQINKI